MTRSANRLIRLSAAAALSLFAGEVLAQSPVPHGHQWIVPGLHGRPVMAPRGVEAVELTKVHAQVDVVDQVASTTLELTLHNPSRVPQEAVLVFPVPDGVSIRAVQYDGTGPEPTATLLAKDQARDIYAEIVRSMKDPALVEFIGLNMIRTSVFPIPAGGTQTLRITMDQVLIAEGSRVDYTLLRSNSLAAPMSTWSVDCSIRSKRSITSIYSPSHRLETRIESGNVAKVRIAGSGSESGSVRLSWLLAGDNSNEPSFSIFACPDPTVAGGKGGYFMVLGSLPSEPRTLQRKREVVLVIDRSGSMRGGKMDQARNAAMQVIEGLSEGEAFNIVDYSDSVRSFAEKPVIKDAQSVKAAKAYLDQVQAQGGTNIHDALVEAMRSSPQDGMLPMTLFLTDGLPTIGERNEAKIRSAVAETNTHHRRIFSFGVGLDVNTPLLSGLSVATRAMSTFVLPDEDLELKVSRVFSGLAGPVLEMPVISAPGRAIRDLEPAELPDYFEGDQIMVLGAYTGDTPSTITFTGSVGGQPRTYQIPFDPSAATMRHDYVPRIWATRRIGALVEQVRQAGAEGSLPPAQMKELTDEIVRLSTKFGVLTEYTAFLSKETTDFRRDALPALSAQVSGELEKRAVHARSGAGSVNQESNIQALKDAGSMPPRASAPSAPGAGGGKGGGGGGGGGADPALAAMPAAASGTQWYLDSSLKKVEVNSIRQIGSQSFYNRQNRWVDSRLLDKENEKPDSTILFGSPEYLTLAQELAATNEQTLLAQDGDILLLFKGKRLLIKSATE
jgi:Ca-activated chloride channel family protein